MSSQKAGLTAHLAAIKAYNAGRRELAGSVAETPMRAKDKMRTAAEVLVDQLRIQGVRHVFCVPGESYLPVLDAFHDRDIAVTVCRQEGGAAMMAEAIGKQTGRPGICFVTRGPGATNASHGIHIAQQDSTPMILFVGQVEREMRGRDAFQELDYRAVFGAMAKWAAEVDDPAAWARWSRALSTRRRTAGRGRWCVALPRRHADRAVGVDDAPAYRAGRDIAGAGGDGEARRAARRSGTSDVHSWRQPLGEAARARAGALRRALCIAGLHHLSPAHALRSAASQLRRRSGPRPQSEAGGAGQGGRPGPAIGGRLSELTIAGLHPVRYSRPQMNWSTPIPAPRNSGRVYRPHLRDPCRADGFCGRARAP